MKKIKYLIFLILMLFFAGGISFAAETLDLNLNNDYLISTEKAINASSIKNQDILTIDQFYTLYNEKNSLILHPVREGKTQFVLFMDSGSYTFNVNVSSRLQSNTTKIIKKGIFEISAIDEPPMNDNDFDIDAPPEKIPVLRTQENSNCGSDAQPGNETQNPQIPQTPQVETGAPVESEPAIDRNTENSTLEAD